MSITDPTIDPITGLPIFDSSGIIQQIPLGRQTTDFASWNATAQPTRGPLFPDDGYPVFSNVQGQHPQTGNAQSVNTDGNHALLVSDVNGGSGGLSPVVGLSYSSVEANTTTSSSRTLVGSGASNITTRIYGWDWSVRVSAVESVFPANYGFAQLQIDGGPYSGNDLMLSNWVFSNVVQLGTAVHAMERGTVVIPQGLDVTDWFNAGGDTRISIFIDTWPLHLYYFCVLWGT